MEARLFAPPVREARLIVVLATLSWLPITVILLISTRLPQWPAVLAETSVFALTALPLFARTQRGLRSCALTLGWLILGLEVVASLPWALLPLIVFVPLFPAGALLLIAAGRSAHATRLIVSVGITALGFVLLTGWALVSHH